MNFYRESVTFARNRRPIYIHTHVFEQTVQEHAGFLAMGRLDMMMMMLTLRARGERFHPFDGSWPSLRCVSKQFVSNIWKLYVGIQCCSFLLVFTRFIFNSPLPHPRVNSAYNKNNPQCCTYARWYVHCHRTPTPILLYHSTHHPFLLLYPPPASIVPSISFISSISAVSLNICCRALIQGSSPSRTRAHSRYRLSNRPPTP